MALPQDPTAVNLCCRSYPQAAFIGCVVPLGLLPSLPPLDQTVAVLPGQGDVTAADGGVHDARRCPRGHIGWNVRFRGQSHLHPTWERCPERTIRADTVDILGVSWKVHIQTQSERILIQQKKIRIWFISILGWRHQPIFLLSPSWCRWKAPDVLFRD